MQVPTVAVESVYIMDNSSIIQDEVLAHRLGLVPLNVDPRGVHFLNGKSVDKPACSNTPHPFLCIDGDAATDSNTLVFKMDITGEAPPAAEDGAQLQRFHHVYSSDFEWVPQGEQEARYTEKPPAPVHSDILLAKLQPGQRIAVEMHAVKGVGKDHAKFSPVATASYRLLPAVELLQPVYDDDAQELAARSKVFDAVPCTDGSGHKLQAVAVRPRLCNMSREILRDPKFADKIHISRVSDHFICKLVLGGQCVLFACRVPPFTSHCICSFGGDHWRAQAS